MTVPTVDTINMREGFRDQGIGSKNLDPKPDARNARLRDAAGQAVGSAFYGTMFEMMRKNPFKTEIGHGGRGEEVFAAQLHGVLAEKMGQSKGLNLSEVLYRRLEKQQRLIDATTAPRVSA